MNQTTLDFFSTATVAFTSAEAWREANPEAYAAVVAWARQDAECGRSCAMQRYIELLRDPDMIPRRYMHRTNAVYLFDHRLRSAVTRLILAEHPDLPFAIRRSTCDAGQFTSATPRVPVMCPAAKP